MPIIAALAGAFERDPENRRALARLATSSKSIESLRDALTFRRGLQYGQLLQRQYRGRPLGSTSWDADTLAGEGYRSNVYVFRTVSSMATAAAQPEWVVKRRDQARSRVGAGSGVRVRRKDDGWEKIEGHPLAQLFERPNELMSRADFMEVVFQSWWLTGNSLTYLGGLESDILPPTQSWYGGGGSMNLPGGNVLQFRRDNPEDYPDREDVELWPLMAVGFRPIPGPDGLPMAFRYENGDVRTDIPFAMFAHLMFRDPSNPFWGFSPFLAAARQIDMDNEALDWNTSLMEKGGASDWVYRLTEETFRSDEEYEEAAQLIMRDHSGSANAGRPHVMGGEWDVQNLGRSPKEMDFNQSRDRLREEILSVAAMPPVVAGFFENATLANAEASRKLWWLDAVMPLLERVRGVFERKLVPIFAEGGEQLILALDYSSIPALREDMTGKLANLEKMTKVLGVPYNEAIVVLDLALDPLPPEWGDVPFGVLRLAEQAQAGAGAPVPPSSSTDQAAGSSVGWSPRYRTPPDPGAGTSARELAGDFHRLRYKLHRRATKDSQPELAIEGFVADVDGLAEDFATVMADALRTAIEDARDGVDRSALASALARNARGEAMGILGLDRLTSAYEALADHYEAAAAAGGDAVATELADLGGNQFDAGRARKVATLRFKEMAEKLLRSNEEGVDAALDAWTVGELGADSEAAADAFASMVGLNSRQCSQAVELWKSMVDWDEESNAYTGDTRAAGKAARLGRGLAEERVQAIADHEAADATSSGQIEAWKQLEREGLVTDLTKALAVSPGSPEVCPVCLSMDGEPIAIDENFYSDFSGEDYEGVPIHPKCYCGIVVSAVLVEEP